MPRKDDLKAAVCRELDRRSQESFAIADRVLHNPELGFKEFSTAKLVAEHFDQLGIPYRSGLAITGVKAVLDSGRPGPTIAVIGELDSVLVFDHPHANPETGAAHACGHNVQIAMLLSIASALKATNAIDSMSGRVVLFAVPAEEYVEVEYRLGLARQGKLEFLGGKPELIKLGEFDDVDMAMMTHTTTEPERRRIGMQDSCNGCVVKQIQFIGRGAHAGSAPEQGINALNAAMVALGAIHAQRETFKDADTVRVHPIITRGGDIVNVVPADVRMETFVRAKTIPAIEDADVKVNRALRAGAVAVGGKVKVRTLPGYLPLVTDQPLAALFKENALTLVDPTEYTEGGHFTGSTDMGDISHIMPAIHPFSGGGRGAGHGNDYEMYDLETALMNPAKAMAMTVVDLLYGDASTAKGMLEGYKPSLTREEYLAFMRKMNNEVTYE